MEKINYQNKLLDIINTWKVKETLPTLLLHTCCAPCSSACIEKLAKYFKITVFYYNPNIEPQEEYLKRKEEQKRFLMAIDSKVSVSFLDCDYDEASFLPIKEKRALDHEGGLTCHRCYRLRLEKTAKEASKGQFDYFGTSLTVSPYKNSQVINAIGEELAKTYSVSYLYSDFKKENGYLRSIELSHQYTLYRQDYCGCFISKKERQKRKDIKKTSV